MTSGAFSYRFGFGFLVLLEQIVSNEGGHFSIGSERNFARTSPGTDLLEVAEGTRR
jgi:hypothetical protein